MESKTCPAVSYRKAAGAWDFFDTHEEQWREIPDQGLATAIQAALRSPIGDQKLLCQ